MRHGSPVQLLPGAVAHRFRQLGVARGDLARARQGLVQAGRRQVRAVAAHHRIGAAEGGAAQALASGSRSVNST